MTTDNPCCEWFLLNTWLLHSVPLLVPFLCAYPHQPDGVSISPPRAASHGGVCDLPLSYPRSKIICICSLILLHVYKIPFSLNSLFIWLEISLANPLSLQKPLCLHCRAFTLLLLSLLFLVNTHTRFGLHCPPVLFTFVCFAAGSASENQTSRSLLPGFVPVSSFTIFFSWHIPGTWCKAVPDVFLPQKMCGQLKIPNY